MFRLRYSKDSEEYGEERRAESGLERVCTVLAILAILIAALLNSLK